MVGNSRESCALYLRHFLTHWPARIDAFNEDFDAWVDNFMRPGNIQGGFNWYLSVAETRLAIARGEAGPQAPKCRWRSAKTPAISYSTKHRTRPRAPSGGCS